MIQRILLISIFALFLNSANSFGSVNFNRQIWKDISFRSQGETILLPLTTEAFDRFMKGLRARNIIEDKFFSFYNDHPQYVENFKVVYGAINSLRESEREALGAFRLVRQNSFAFPVIQAVANFNTEISLRALMSVRRSESSSNTPVALHLYRIDVLEDFDDTMNDSLYVYYVTTDGTVTWGNVTDIYESIDEGDSVMLSAADRVIYPPRGVSSKIPNRHLIVDYGVMESDGDDITNMQNLSKDIITLAAEVLKLVYPEKSLLTDILARETQTLISTILALNSDDRMAVGTINLSNENINSLLYGVTSSEFTREHKGKDQEFPFNSKWHYRLGFRLLKGNLN